MSPELRFELEIEHLAGYEFKVKFDLDEVPELLLDEPPPLGGGKGPNASRILAAAAANCLSASLLFCLHKAKIEPQGMKTCVTGRLTRNAQGRVRVEGVDVAIHLAGIDHPAARLGRCAELFEGFCVVTASVRQGIPVKVDVYSDGELVYSAD